MAHLAFLTLLISFSSSFGFNIDLENYIKHDGPPRSMFGFSVAAHAEGSERWVIVGAPEAQSNQPNITNGGAVYRCHVSHSGCEPIPFNTNGNNRYGDSEIDSKSYQWFGATVSSANGAVLACAPRYIWYTTSNTRRDPVGTCYAGKKNLTEFSEFSPCRTKQWGYHRQGSCQAGLGAAVSKDGERMFIGAPGSWYWQGQLHSVSGAAKLPFLPRMVIIFEEGVVISQNMHTRPDVFSTTEGPAIHDDSYLGYSVASGDFHRIKEDHSDVVVGVPRGEKLRGKVVIYTWNLTNVHNISGEQLGAYFGYSICSGDIDGDGYDDIIVGAPLYTDLNNNDWSYENGRIYVFYQGKEGGLFKEYNHRDGKNSKGRFGLSLAFLGDINKDGYGDFAVGAPYDGPSERGAVYIYHGSIDGVAEEASQIIKAEDIPGDARTFGFSMAGGVDMDDNLYPDLIIGAYETENTFLMRSRPVVKVESSVEFLKKSKQISLDEKNCYLRDRKRVSCAEMRSCVKYYGVGVDNSLDFEYQITLDSKNPKTPRMFFSSEEGKNVIRKPDRLEKGQQKCITFSVYLKENIRDKLTTLDAELKLKLFGSAFRSPRSLLPILDMSEERTWRDSLTIQKNCGKDNTCIPDLRLIARPNVTTYLLGSGQRLAIEVSVQNEGEDAFEATYALRLPPGLSYVKIVSTDDADAVSRIVCSAPSSDNNQTLLCDIGNPLPKEQLVQFKVILQPYNLEGGMKPKYEFAMSVNSTNPENFTSVSDNSVHIDLPIWVRTELQLEGTSQPKEIHYTTTQFDAKEITQENEIGPQVVHVYSIRNIGPSDFLEGEVEFLWPSYTLSGEPLLYLLENPHTEGKIQCERVSGVNARNIRLDEKRRKNYFETESSSSESVQSALEGSQSGSSSHHSSHISHSSSHFGSSHSGSLHSGSSHSGSSHSGSSHSGSSHSGSSHSSKPFSQSSHSSSSTSSHKMGNKRLSAEEKRRLEIEIKRKEDEESARESGDSSTRYWERRQESNQKSKFESDSHSKPVGHHKLYEEEQHTQTNTTWNSGEKPVITSSKNWRVNKDGEVRNGSSTNIREGKIYHGKHSDEHGVIQQGSRVEESSSHSSSHSQRGPSIQGGRNQGSTRIEESSIYSSSHTERGHSGHRDSSLQGGTQRNQGSRRVEESSSRSSSERGYSGPRTQEASRSNQGSIHAETSGHISHGEERRTAHRTTSYDEKISNGHSSHIGSSSHDGDLSIHTTSVDEERPNYRERFPNRKVEISESHSEGRRTGHRGYHEDRHKTDKNRSHITESGILDQNIIGEEISGGKVYTKEYEKNYNMTYTSDGKPITHVSHSWKVNEDGKDTSGSKSETLEGHHSFDKTEKHSGERFSGSTINEEKHRVSSEIDSGRTRVYNDRRYEEGSERNRGSSRSNTRKNEEIGGFDSHSSSGSGKVSIEKISESTNNYGSNVGDILAGHGDGVARTHVFDLGIDQGSSSSRSGSKQVHYRSNNSQKNHPYEDSNNRTYMKDRVEGSTSAFIIKSHHNDKDYSGHHLESTLRASSSSNGDEEDTGRSHEWREQYSGMADGDKTEHGGSYQARHISNERDRTFTQYVRNKRDVDPERFSCGPVKCIKIYCTLGAFKKDDEALIAFRSRVWTPTIKKMTSNIEFLISSQAVARVTKLPHIGRPLAETTPTNSAETISRIVPSEPQTETKVIPLWVVVLSACAGALILMLLVYALYKCGFFKRNRPSNAPEKQPLNRNGHYNGDEAL